VYVTFDGRGTPSPKGRAWRKAIYRNIGRINVRDMAMGAIAVFEKYDFIDTSRVAVHGWSGGGTATLNCLFQYPEIFHTGIAVAAVANQLTYDNIYQERYMGDPKESYQDYVDGSPIKYAKNLEGNDQGIIGWAGIIPRLGGASAPGQFANIIIFPDNKAAMKHQKTIALGGWKDYRDYEKQFATCQGEELYDVQVLNRIPQ